jgi:CheY-like chemotaxis protein
LALKIVLVDDQPVPGLTLRRWLRKQRDLQVVGEAVPGSPVLALIPLVEPDVVVVDVHTSPEAGLNVARMIREHYPNVPIVAIGEASAGSVRVEAAEAGAWAFFPKTRPEDLARAIPSVIESKGRTFLDLTDRSFHRPAPDSFVALPGEGVRQRAPDSFVAVPVEKAPPRAPQPPPAAREAAAPAAPEVPPLTPKVPPRAANPKVQPRAANPKVQPRAANPKVQPRAANPKVAAKATPQPAPTDRTRRGRQGPANGGTKQTADAWSDPPARGPRDAVAWTHSALEPVSDQAPQRKPRRRRGKKDERADEIDVRGPTGLPRRFGRHR